MVMWVCEAWQVNIWTVFAVRPNGPNNNFASSRSDHLGSDKNIDRGTTDPEIDSVTWTKFGNHIIHDSIYISFKLGSKMVPLALVAKLATR